MKQVSILGVALGAFLLGYFISPSEPDQKDEDEVVASNCSEASSAIVKKNYDSLRQQYTSLQDELSEVQSQLEETSRCSSDSAESGSDRTANDAQTNPDQVDPDAPGLDAESESAESTEGTETEEWVDPQGELGINDLLTGFKKHEKQAEKYGKKVDSRGGFLKRMLLRDPRKTIEGMPMLKKNDKFFHKLRGKFAGSIKFFNKRRKHGYVQLRVKDVDPEHPSGWTVRVQVAGKKIAPKGSAQKSPSVKYGGYDMLRSVGPKSRAYFIRSSETSYLQFYYQESQDRLFGNYYEKRKNNAYRRIATILMNRKDL